MVGIKSQIFKLLNFKAAVGFVYVISVGVRADEVLVWSFNVFTECNGKSTCVTFSSGAEEENIKTLAAFGTIREIILPICIFIVVYLRSPEAAFAEEIVRRGINRA